MDASLVIAGLVVAAGSGSRLGGEIPKQFRMLGGRAVLRRSINALRAHPRLSEIQVVRNPEHDALYQQAITGLDLPPPVPGGDTRQESVRLGLEALATSAPDIVLIHDAARPFLSLEVIDRVIAALDEADGAVVGLPVVDTLRRSAGGDAPSRDGLWRVQTPQAFRYPAILEAHRALAGRDFTDDASLAEKLGQTISMVPGTESLFKITSADDLARAEQFLESMMETRTGSGFDVHRFGPGDKVILGGVAIPHAMGLAGHSDADVALHALTDALLGAISAGDIGAHFPPSDPKWRGADSAVFLSHAGDLVAGRGGDIVNLDLTIICQQPRIGPHRAAMVARIADILGIAPGRVSVKATTTEGLGFTGRGEGIAAQATATVRIPSDDN